MNGNYVPTPGLREQLALDSTIHNVLVTVRDPSHAHHKDRDLWWIMDCVERLPERDRAAGEAVAYYLVASHAIPGRTSMKRAGKYLASGAGHLPGAEASFRRNLLTRGLTGKCVFESEVAPFSYTRFSLPVLPQHAQLERALRMAFRTMSLNVKSNTDQLEQRCCDVMEQVQQLPPADRTLGEGIAYYFVGSHAQPGKEAMSMAAEYLFGEIGNLQPPTDRLRRALVVGGMTTKGQFQDAVVSYAAERFAQVEMINPGDAAVIAPFTRGGMGVANNADFSRALHTRLRPPKPPASPCPSGRGNKLGLRIVKKNDEPGYL
jgi:hypothetical protein